MFGSQTFDLQPDIMTCAKALSAGYLPISANLVSNRLYDVLLAQSDKLGIFGHGYTYSAHPVPAAVALETLKIYEERDIVGAGAPRRPAAAGGPPQLRRSPARRRGARHRADRRRRARPRQGDQAELRPEGRRRRVPRPPRAAPRRDPAQHAGRHRRVLPAADHQRGGDRRDARLLRQGARRHAGRWCAEARSSFEPA